MAEATFIGYRFNTSLKAGVIAVGTFMGFSHDLKQSFCSHKKLAISKHKTICHRKLDAKDKASVADN